MSQNRTSEAQRDLSPALEDIGYDDMEELGQ